jgi:hypothetical protein
MEDDKDDDSFSDDDIAALPSSTLLQLERIAYEAAQKQRADSISTTLAQRLSHPRPRSLALDSNSDPSTRAPSRGPILQDPSRLRQPLSFGETDFQDLDAGVLDDGNGPAPVEVQETSFASRPKHEVIRPDQEAGVLRDDIPSKGLAAGEWRPPLVEGDNPPRRPELVADADDNISRMRRATAKLTLEGAVNDTNAVAAHSIAEMEDMREQIEQVWLATSTIAVGSANIRHS